MLANIIFLLFPLSGYEVYSMSSGLEILVFLFGIVVGAVLAYKLIKSFSNESTEQLDKAIAELRYVKEEFERTYSRLKDEINYVYSQTSEASFTLSKIDEKLDELKRKLHEIEYDIDSVDDKLSKLIRVLERRLQFKVQVKVNGKEVGK